MANALAPLPLQTILVYAHPLTRPLADLFSDSDNLYVAAEERGQVVLKHPREAAQGDEVRAIHWGFEYAAGTTVRVGDRALTAPRASRFYPCWNPVNNRLRLSETFTRFLLQRACDLSHILVAGYQVLSPDYPDGRTCLDYLLPTLDFLKALQQANPGLRLHFECDTIPGDPIRRAVLNHVLPIVDSLGLNEVELDYFIKDMRGEKLGELGGAGSAAYYLDGLIQLADRTGLPRIHFHNFGYYLCVERPDRCDPERTRQALVLSAVIAADRARTGGVTGTASFDRVRDVPLSDEGIEQMDALSRRIGAPARTHPDRSGDFLGTGWAEYRGYHLTYLPTRVVRTPLLTVGLGDTISAVAFLTG